MKKLRKNHPILLSVLLVLVFFLVSGLVSLPFLMIPQLAIEDLYLLQSVAGGLALLVFALLAVAMGLGKVFRPAPGPLYKKLVPCLPMALIYMVALAESLIMLEVRVPRPPMSILWFVLCMLVTGMVEELLFRGLITRILYEKFGRTSVGVWISVLLSSLLFGLVHLSNAADESVPISSAMVQAVAAAVLGMSLAAIYLRTRSYWTVALLHAFMDFCALAASGIFGAGELSDALGSYDVSQLAGAAVYLVIALFLLRPGKIRLLTDPEAEPPGSHVVLLMVAVLLLSGLISAVTVLSL